MSSTDAAMLFPHAFEFSVLFMYFLRTYSLHISKAVNQIWKMSMYKLCEIDGKSNLVRKPLIYLLFYKSVRLGRRLYVIESEQWNRN